MEISEIRQCMKELENAKDTEFLLSTLEKLDKEFKPTEKLLRETKLGVAVNRLRSHADERVSKIVVEMIGRWREQVSAQKAGEKAKAAATSHKKSQAASGSGSGAGAGSGSGSGAGAGSGSGSGSGASTGSGSGSGSGPGPAFKSDKPRSAKSDGVNIAVYSDKTRNSCVEVIYNALCLESTEQPTKVLDASKGVEAAVFTGQKGTTPEYRTKIRSLFSNLKNPKNPELRHAVLSGKISGTKLYGMSPQELAPKELREEMEEINKQNLFNAQGAKEQRATTDRFTCSKCKQKKVSYSQMQTRSADEPLTTFCQCENCGNRWKFS